jgi:predicted Zn-dependent protease
VLKAQPNTVPALALLAASYLRLGEPAQAIPHLTKVIAAQPNDKESRAMMADALLMTNRFADALPHMRKLTTIDPTDPKSWYGLGRCYEAMAQQAFSELETKAPESAYTLALVAETRMTQQQYSSALALYREALKRDAGIPGAHEAIAEIYRRTKHEDWAKIEESRVKPSPESNSPEAILFRKISEYNTEAIKAFAKLGGMPASLELHQLRAEIHRNHGRYQDAVTELQAALKLGPNNGEIRRNLASAYYGARDYKTAEPMIRDLLKAEPNAPDLNFLLGDTLLNTQQVDAALPYLKAAAERDPSFLPAQAALGRAYLQAGIPAAAAPHLEAALSIDNDGSLHYQLARALQSNGEESRAKEMMARYQQLSKAASVGTSGTEAQITPP